MKYKAQFYSKGIDQKRSDLEFSIRRPDVGKIKSYDLYAKIDLQLWIEDCEKKFKIFKKEIQKEIQKATL